MSEICVPVQELQVGDLSTLIVRAPLSLLLKKKKQHTKKGVNQADVQLTLNYFKHFADVQMLETAGREALDSESKSMEMKT